MAKQGKTAAGTPKVRNARRAILYTLPTYRRLQRLVAANVRAERERLGLTQEDAAEASKMSVRLWQHVEAGTANLSLITIARVVDGLKMDAASLFQPR